MHASVSSGRISAPARSLTAFVWGAESQDREWWRGRRFDLDSAREYLSDPRIVATRMSLAALGAEVVGTRQALREVMAVRRRRDRLAVCRMAAAEPQFAALPPAELYSRAAGLLGALDGLLLMRSLDPRMPEPVQLVDALFGILDPNVGYSAGLELPPEPDPDFFPGLTPAQEAALDALMADPDSISGRFCDIDAGVDSFTAVASQVLEAFDSQEAFFAALMERRARLMLERKVTTAATADEVSGRGEALISWTHYELGQMRGLAEIALAQSALAVCGDHPNHGYFVNRQAADLHSCAHSIDDLSRAGRTRSGVDPNVAVAVFASLMAGMILHELLEPGDVDVELVLARYLDTQVLG
jgi:hypothetical protein